MRVQTSLVMKIGFYSFSIYLTRFVKGKLPVYFLSKMMPVLISVKPTSDRFRSSQIGRPTSKEPADVITLQMVKNTPNRSQNVCIGV